MIRPFTSCTSFTLRNIIPTSVYPPAIRPTITTKTTNWGCRIRRSYATAASKIIKAGTADKMVVRDLPKVRLLILETDETELETQQDKGHYGQVLHHHFSKAGLNHDPPLGVETDRRFVVAEKGGKVPAYDEIKEYHAILMTGSCFDAHGDNPWILDLMNLLRGKNPPSLKPSTEKRLIEMAQKFGYAILNANSAACVSVISYSAAFSVLLSSLNPPGSGN